MTTTYLPGNPADDETKENTWEIGKEHDLSEKLPPKERDEVRKEAVHAISDDKRIWHGSDYTGGYRSARHNRRVYAEAGAKEEVIVAAVKACQRGFWGERLSSGISLEQAQTVFVSRFVDPGELQDVQIVDVWHNKARPENNGPRLSMEQQEEEDKTVVREAVSLLSQSSEGSKSKEVLPKTEKDWDAYIERNAKDTVEPDGVLANTKMNRYTGIVEVKTYTVAEVQALISGLKARTNTPETVSTISSTQANVEIAGPIQQMALGADLEGEFQYLANNIISNKESSTLDMLAVLRFPEDIPDALLVELGGFLEKAHYKVIIQKIPFTNEEINMLAKAKIARDFPHINRNDLITDKGPRFFTPRDIRIYDKLSDKETEW